MFYHQICIKAYVWLYFPYFNIQDLQLFDEIRWVGNGPPVAEPKCGFRGQKCISKKILYDSFNWLFNSFVFSLLNLTLLFTAPWWVFRLFSSINKTFCWRLIKSQVLNDFWEFSIQQNSENDKTICGKKFLLTNFANDIELKTLNVIEMKLCSNGRVIDLEWNPIVLM